MKLLSIEPTPSPNAMKLNMDEALPAGKRYSLTKAEAVRAPEHLKRLLSIDGVKGVYQAADFISLERENGADWRGILNAVHEAFADAASGAGANDGAGGAGGANALAAEAAMEGYGEAAVFVQVFRGIPMQVRVRTALEEARVALPERFTQAAMTAGLASANLIKERQLVAQGVRYGDLSQVADEVAAELDAAYDDDRLRTLVRQAVEMGASGAAEAAVGEAAAGARAEARAAEAALTPEEIARRLDAPEWKKRYAALERLKPAPEHLPILEKALADGNFSVRRLAVVYLGDLKTPQAVELLTHMLRDPNAAVRRTAGDALSDIGDAAAQPAMIAALGDPSKIVRWRAARFLYDCGDAAALDALREAASDPEFEVALQSRMAAERIASGTEAAGTVWQQMARRNEK
jgi:hypothetical protein